MKHKNYSWLLLMLVILNSCEKEVTFKLKDPEPALCLNCIMEAGNRDSIIIHLSKIQGVENEREYIPVVNAQIALQKNRVFLNGIVNCGNGKYVLKQAPEPGAAYKIEVQVEGYKPLKAETIVPDFPETQAWFRKDTIPDDSFEKGYIIQDKLEIELTDNPGKDNYWFVSARMKNIGGLYGSFGIQYRSNNLLFDSFNRYATQDYWAPFTNFEYYGALRLSDENLTSDKFNFSMSTSNCPTLFIINADKHFDKYYKSSIKQFLVYEYEQQPIFEQVQIYSNIENGFGIFGSFAVKSYYFDEELN